MPQKKIEIMNVEKKIIELKSVIGKTDEESRKRFSDLLEELKNNSDKALKAEVEKLITEGLKETKEEINSLRQQIGEDYDILPLSYIAENYFHKSKAWLYQRLNGYKIKGHTYTLSQEQKMIFNEALQDIAKRIGSLSLS